MVALYKAGNTPENCNRIQESIPTNDYIGMIISEEKKVNNEETGEYLLFTFRILEGEFKGYTLYDYLSFWGDSEWKIDKAWERFNTICYYVNKQGVTDTKLVHNIPILLKVVQYKDDKNEERNRIKTYDFAPSTSEIGHNYDSNISNTDNLNTNVGDNLNTTQEQTQQTGSRQTDSQQTKQQQVEEQQVNNQTTESTQALDPILIQALTSGALTIEQIYSLDPNILKLLKDGAISIDQAKTIMSQQTQTKSTPNQNTSQQNTTINKSTSLWDD